MISHLLSPAELARRVDCPPAMSDSYDSPWKEMLERYFPDFMAFFFPEAWREIDWSRGYESLDQDLQQVVRDAESGKRLADRLMKVWRLDGEELYVLIHIEIQGQHDAEFPLRMYIYNYRLFDRYQRPIVSLAILGDDGARWRPEEYGYELWGCRAGLRFPVVKLRDYNQRWAELEQSVNPFAVVVMAHLKTRATRRDPEHRYRWKIQLVRRLYEGGFGRQDILELFRFLDWVLALPGELQERFESDVERFETETSMRYMTKWERRGFEKGIQEGVQLGVQQGVQQGEASVIKRLLTRRFDRLPAWAEKRLATASREDLESWADRVIDAEALEDVFATE